MHRRKSKIFEFNNFKGKLPAKFDRVFVERLTNLAVNLSLPLFIMGLKNADFSARYFLASVFFQACLQINNLFGIEYNTHRLRQDPNETGKQNLTRLFASVLSAVVIFTFKPVSIDAGTMVIGLVFIILQDLTSTYRFAISARNMLTSRSSIALSLVHVFYTSLSVHFIDHLSSLLISQIILLLCMLCLYRTVGRIPIIFWVDFAWAKGAFRGIAYFSPLIWAVTRADRILIGYLSLTVPASYLVAAALSDTLFNLSRQYFIIKGSFVWKYLIAVFGLWSILYLGFCIGKDVSPTVYVVIPGLAQFIAMRLAHRQINIYF